MTVPTVRDAVAPGRSVLGRALAVLDSFSNGRPEQTLGAIAQETGLPSATAYRLVNELVAWGALERVGRGRYRIGLRLWQLGSLAPRRAPCATWRCRSCTTCWKSPTRSRTSSSATVSARSTWNA